MILDRILCQQLAVGPKSTSSRSNDELAAETGDSTSQIKRYIRLKNLVPELLELGPMSILWTKKVERLC